MMRSAAGWVIVRGLSAIGRVLFAIAMIGFGSQLLVHGRFLSGLFPAQAWTPPLPPLAYALGASFVVAGLLLFVPRFARCAAIAIAAVLGVCIILMNATQIATVIYHGTARTRVLEPLAIGSAALVLSTALGGNASRNRTIDRAARYIFAFCLIIFGVQHFLYAGGLADLVPAWIPAHLALIYITGTAFIAAGIAIAANVQARLAAELLGLMFLLWALVLHTPRVTAAPASFAELASLFVALAMCGSSWIVASKRH